MDTTVGIVVGGIFSIFLALAISGIAGCSIVIANYFGTDDARDHPWAASILVFVAAVAFNGMSAVLAGESLFGLLNPDVGWHPGLWLFGVEMAVTFYVFIAAARSVAPPKVKPAISAA